MRILVACEESQTVCKAFRLIGHEAYSCDILESSGGHPEWHIQDDVLNHLHGWDMIIAFPPCTDLATISGARWIEKKRQDGRLQKAIDFFMCFVNAPCNKIAIENPVGVMSTYYRKPDQIIYPYQFGEPISKRTCLWLKNLPLLVPTNIVPKPKNIRMPNGNTMSQWYYDTGILPPKDRAKIRSKTFQGIANAMADQWRI